MAEEPTERKSARTRRANIKKPMDEIYLYDIPGRDEEAGSNEGEPEIKSDDDQHADDDSFSYNGPKPRRNIDGRRGRGK